MTEHSPASGAPVAIVTGASRGIGAAIARALAEDGYDLLLTYVSNEGAAEAVAEECRGFGRRVEVVRADQADPASVDIVFDALDHSFGRVDVLVNNAGVLPDVGRVEAISRERLERIVTVNTMTPALMCGAAVRRMSTARSGHGGVIVNMSSRAAHLSAAGEAVDYAMSKAAIDILTIGLAREVGTEGIRVVGVRPGLIDTDMNAAHEGRLERLGPTVPMGRVGTADEIADAVRWLVSDGAGYITGFTIDVSGGR